MSYVFCCGEDELSANLGSSIFNNIKSDIEVDLQYKGGVDVLRKDVEKLCNMSKAQMVAVFVDLDKNICAAKFRKEWLKNRNWNNKNFVFRAAVRESEAWLLADRKNLAKYINVAEENFPQNPEDLNDPKQKLLCLLNRSKKRIIKQEVINIKNGNLKPGVGYNEFLKKFIRDEWQPFIAAQNAPSLQNTINRISRMLSE